MRRLVKILVIGVIAILILLGGILYGTSYGPYIREISGIFLQMMSSNRNENTIWFYSKAQVTEADVSYYNEALGSVGTISLRFASENGTEQKIRLRVFSLSNTLSELKQGDILRISVCKHNPKILRSDRFTVSDKAECVEPSDPDALSKQHH